MSSATRSPAKTNRILVRGTSRPPIPGAKPVGVYVAKGPEDVPSGATGGTMMKIRAKTKEEAQEIARKMLAEQRALVKKQREELEKQKQGGGEFEFDPNDLPPEDVFDEDSPFLPEYFAGEEFLSPTPTRESGSEEIEEEEEEPEVWSTSTMERSADGERTPSSFSFPTKESEGKKNLDKVNIFIGCREAQQMGTYSEEAEQWVRDIAEEMERDASGSVRIVVSPAIRTRDFLSPQGYGVGVMTTSSAVTTVKVPIDVYDPFRLFSGFYAVCIPDDEAHAIFYRKMAGCKQEELLELVKSVRKECNFQLKESFIGVFAQKGAETLWRTIYWLVVRDGDVEASNALYEKLEASVHLSFFEQMRQLPEDIKKTREANESRRADLAKLLYHRLSGENGEIHGINETTTTTHAIYSIQEESALVVASNMALVQKKRRHIVLGDLKYGLTLLEGARSGDEWSGKSFHFFMLPCQTPEDSAGTPASVSMEDRVHGPVDMECGKPLDYEWKSVMANYQREVGMSEIILEPCAIAVSEFKGHALEESEFSEF